MPKVLVIRYEGNPFLVRMSKVIQTLLDAGWECDVLIPEGGLGSTNVGKEMGRDLASEVSLEFFPVATEGLDRLGRGPAWVAVFGNRTFERHLTRLLRHQHYDAILVKDTPCLKAVFRCLKGMQASRPRVFCDMYENMSEQIYDFFIRYGSWRTRLRARAFGLIPHIRRLERRFPPLCDHTFVVVEEAKQFLLHRYALDPSHVSVVHNVERLDDFDSILPPEVTFAGGDFLISYVGGFGPHRGIEGLITAAGQLAASPLPPFKVALVGAPLSDLHRLSTLSQRVGAQGVVRILPTQPHRVAMQWIKQSDLGVIPHVDTPQIRTTIPNKLFQYMAAGVGLACSDVGPLGRIVRETGCGLLFHPESAEGMAECLRYAIRNRDVIRQMGARGRQAVELRYRWEIEATAYENVFGSVVPCATEERRTGTLRS